jgi:trimethylamine--corrinoid protein Co-methyltransferase
MGRVSGLIRILDHEEMGRIHCAALTILQDVGMRIEHQPALRYLESSGCTVDYDAQTAKFPATVVEGAVERMRADHKRERAIEGKIPMRYTTMCFSTMPRRIHHDFDINTGGFPPFVLDLEGQRRPATMQDVRDSIRLADGLENIDLVGLPCSAQEVPAKLRPVVMAAELVKHTGKVGGIEAWSKKDVEYLTQIATVVRGGEDELRAHPILIGYGEAKSPLCFDSNMVEVFMEYVKRGFPQSVDTMPAGGTTAPATSAGTLTLAIAETLGGLVLGYAIDEDAYVGIDVCPTLTDMSSMIYPYAGADRIPLVAAGCQMIAEFYGRPSGCHGGKTEACVPGAQAGVEKALSIIFPVLAGATGVGTLGHLENAITFSYVQLVIDDAIAGYIKRMLRGFEVTDETIALDVIKEGGIGGNFLAHESTARLFRREFWLPELFERMTWQAWNRQEIKGLEEKAKWKAHHILAEHYPEPLDREMVKEIDTIVERAQNDPFYRR